MKSDRVPPAATEPPESPVKRRRVFYIPGFIGLGPELHHGLFRREAEKFAALWDVRVETGALGPSDGFAHGGAWRMTMTAPEDVVETDVEVLRWDDLVAIDLASPILTKLARGAVAFGDAFRSGALLRVYRAAPWFAFAWVYPYLWLLACAAAGTLAGVVAASWLGIAVGIAVGIGSAFAALWLLGQSNLFALHLLDDWIAQRRYRRGEDAALESRLDAFADRLVESVRSHAPDEALLVGHSSGSFLAIDVMARALARDPSIGRRGTELSLLTLGTAELLVALHPGGHAMRNAIARLAREPSLFWAEVAARFDVLNFSKRSPLEELGLTAAGANPTFRRVKMAEMVDRLRFPAAKRLWHVMRLHFQFVMANDLKGPYDFYSLVCGTRLARRQFLRAKGEPMSPVEPSPRFARVRGVV